MKPVPDAFAKRIIELHGDAGVDWLSRLPSIIAKCSERWSLTVMAPFEQLSYNFVAPAILRDGTSVVLKLGVPNTELLTEMRALKLFNGHGIVQLLETDPSEGALLLEGLTPGTPLSESADERQTTSIAAGVMRRLGKPVAVPPSEHPFPTVQTWANGLVRLRGRFGGGTGPFTSRLVAEAETLFQVLIDSMTEPVLLHGDLHHQNILAAQREPWLAVDPKGVIGEPAYEVGAFLRNPMPQLLRESQLRRVLERRADQIAEELGFDRQRIVGWALAQAVLSAWWSYEDHGEGWEPAMICAEALSALN